MSKQIPLCWLISITYRLFSSRKLMNHTLRLQQIMKFVPIKMFLEVKMFQYV